MALLHGMGADARKLREFPAFSTFTDGQLEKIVKLSGYARLPAGWAVIHERTPGDACYILLAGRVAVFAGQEKVAELGPGELIGEVSLRENKLRSATVTTLEPVELLRIESDNLNLLLREIKALGTAIDATLKKRMGGPAR
jgi:CRP-like cAMP-binding protein